jgi:serine/threonine protein kinase
MLSGLLFLHSKGYIHRDIKPSNLLLDHNVVKLADFGCTTSVQVGQGGDNSNGHNTIIGTTIYMSPEVMRGNEETEDESAPIGYGRKADIWSVGITMVEMATGKLPFRNPASAIYTICVSKEYPTLPEEFSVEAHHFLSRSSSLSVLPDLSLSLPSSLRCLVENPKDRASCEEIYEHSFCRPMVPPPPLSLSL